MITIINILFIAKNIARKVLENIYMPTDFSSYSIFYLRIALEMNGLGNINCKKNFRPIKKLSFKKTYSSL